MVSEKNQDFQMYQYYKRKTYNPQVTISATGNTTAIYLTIWHHLYFDDIHNIYELLWNFIYWQEIYTPASQWISSFITTM